MGLLVVFKQGLQQGKYGCITLNIGQVDPPWKWVCTPWTSLCGYHTTLHLWKHQQHMSIASVFIRSTTNDPPPMPNAWAAPVSRTLFDPRHTSWHPLVPETEWTILWPFSHGVYTDHSNISLGTYRKYSYFFIAFKTYKICQLLNFAMRLLCRYS